MPMKPIEELIDQQRGWLDPFGKTLANWVQSVGYAGGPVGTKAMDILHGVWLGHPLHPAATDVPVGAWTAATLLDVADTFASGNDGVRSCADAAVGVGILGGLLAAPAGLADWHHTKGATRRMGLVHGLLNVVILVLYTVSYFLRKGKARPAGVSVGLMAYTLASVSAYIGGELVYQKGIGVDHTAFEKPPRDWATVLPELSLQESKPVKVMANGAPVMLVKQAGRIYAISHTCTHLGGPLAEGTLEGDQIECPWHGSHFALEDGAVRRGPATFPEVAYDVRVREGQVEVRPRA